MTERRKFLRFRAPLDMEFKTLTQNPIFGKALARDLSKEGIRFGLNDRLAVGTPMEIALSVPGDNLPVFAQAKIAWTDGLEAGARLTKINPSDRARVLEYVYKEWIKTSRLSGAA